MGANSEDAANDDRRNGCVRHAEQVAQSKEQWRSKGWSYYVVGLSTLSTTGSGHSVWETRHRDPPGAEDCRGRLPSRGCKSPGRPLSLEHLFLSPSLLVPLVDRSPDLDGFNVLLIDR
jgi:hypothetical protein